MRTSETKPRDPRQVAPILRNVSQIAEALDIVVIGSKSVLGTFDEAVLPDEVIGSIEADIAFLNGPANEKSDKVEGAIGELASLHEMYGYCAEGVSTSTAVLGPGWEDRLVVSENETTNPGRGLCLERHDCVSAKLAAGREKDFEFAAALLREGLVDSARLIERIEVLPIHSTHKQRLVSWARARAPKTPGEGI